VKIVKEKNLIDQAITIGSNANKESCLAIAKGEHNAEIDNMPHILSLAALKTAIFISRNETWDYDKTIKNGEYDIPVVITPIMLINKYNLIVMRDRWPELNKYINSIKE
ncbi:MAG: sugar ABC transporter substrate-binding protein, partial [Halanaerobiaceae bacterium]|nr:sugar ABC transporter substrate-binding protein [Halanaerobiaceae bacterium]